ncbi:MAG: zinc ribbon domain-containing protein [Chloroflexi bacterium]|nr:zinc ribbon domain-containing protein [Chloroflexota bacterium]
MPIYEYECGSCNHRFELKQGFDAEPVEICPRCQGTSRRMFHSPAIIYKGSGFYTTDYARKSYSPPGEAAEKQDAPSYSKKEPETSSTPNADQS